METQRQKKVARLLLKELSEIFQQDKRGILENKLITVMDVKVSPDLSVAKIYLSFMMVQEKEHLFERINERKNEIRNLLGKSVGKQLRIVPEIIFYKDEVEEKASRLEDILKNLNIPPAENDNN
ncbi:MAG: 30S ribosome-binding factor RbfA [Cyclobacteriaceae bacterium]|nr:30S ribosome-binding factor RbfA [Cyclobacteriaceae bacterium]